MGQEEIKKGLQRAILGYNIDIKKEDVQNRFDETCQGTVLVALWIITQSDSFEDAIRKAVSLGADADTLGAIVGSIAESIWGIPEWMEKTALTYLPDEMKQVLDEFKNERFSSRTTIADGTIEELLAFLKDDQRSAEANVDRVVANYITTKL